MNSSKVHRTLQYQFIIALLSSASAINCLAQVTIGSTIPPVEGALLELRQKDITTKGLHLPRVKLTSLESLDDIDPQSTNRPDSDTHIGLTVYNVANDSICPTIDPGIYIWLGSQWHNIRKTKKDFLYTLSKNPTSRIIIEQDQEGNPFAAASFGEAGIWMLHNLAVTKYSDGTPIAQYSGVSERGAAAYSYPNATPGDWGNPPSTYKREQGLLYTWAAATKGYNPGDIDQAQYDTSSIPGTGEVENTGTEGSAPNMYVQGICPDGWHVPSDREWNQLAKEVYTYAEKYSTYTAEELPLSPPWDPEWEITVSTGYRGVVGGEQGQGSILKDPCTVSYFMNLPASQGKGLPISEGGFSAKLTGFISSDKIFNYGLFGYFWTSSASSQDRAWFRFIYFDSAAGGRNTEDKRDLLSIRCKKN